MKSYLSSMCYIIPEGAAREEACTWEELRASIEQGSLSMKSLLYDPDTKEWVRLDTIEELGSIGTPAAREAGEARAETGDDCGALAEDHREIQHQLQVQPDSRELILKAGREALSLGKQDEAFTYFQRALDLHPFNARIANEIKQSFPPAVYRAFRLLERKRPYWEDPMAAVTFARQNGWKWYAIITPVLSALLFVPWADPVYWIVLALLGVHALREAAAGSSRPFPADVASARTLTGSLKTLAALMPAGAELLAPCLAAAAVALAFEGSGRWNVFAYVAHSPLMAVVLFTMGAMYLPAVLIRNADCRAPFADNADPRRMFRIVKAMEMEYVMSALGVAAVAVCWAAVGMILSPVPVVREVVSTGAGLFGLALIGYLAGRAYSRHAHLFDRSAPKGASNPE